MRIEDPEAFGPRDYFSRITTWIGLYLFLKEAVVPRIRSGSLLLRSRELTFSLYGHLVIL